MAKYSVVIAKSASKELAKLPLDVIDRIQQAVNALVDDSRPANCKNSKGLRACTESALAITGSFIGLKINS